MSLWADFQRNRDGRVIHKWKHYFPIYERHFAAFVNRPVTLLEIGCGDGGSLQMWKRHFGPHATIVGIDIAPRCKAFEEDQICIRIGSQDDSAFLAGVEAEFGPFDIIIDDGSHMMPHVIASFEHLYANVSKGGVYLVEDLHTAYWPEFGGGAGNAGTFIERAKRLVDELNANHARGEIAPTEFTRTTHSICFYDSVIVFERGVTTKKWAPRIGQEAKKPGFRIKIEPKRE